MKSSPVRCFSPIQTTKHVKRLRRQLFMTLMDDPKNTYHYTGKYISYCLKILSVITFHICLRYYYIGLTKESIELVYGHLKSKAKKLKLWKGPQRTVDRKKSRLKKIQVRVCTPWLYIRIH